MAFKTLQETERCHLFEDIANWVWVYVVSGHQRNRDRTEEGITRDIIVKLLNHRVEVRETFTIYAKEGWRESDFGSDMDIFVEVSPNKFRWFALQAKLLKKNNRYDTLRDSSNGRMQWEKLMLLEGLSGCKSYYLLYNGLQNPDADNLGVDCAGPYNIMQYGCSLVEPTHMERFANQKNLAGVQFKNPTFQDIHPDFALPWRMLTCCAHKSGNPILYTIDQIEKSDPDFVNIPDVTELDDIADALPLIQYIQPERIRNPIRLASDQTGWNPPFRIVINQTQSL